MDNLSHGLWGIGIYGAWLAQQPHVVHSPLTTTVFLASVLGSEAPDADYVVKLVRGPQAYLKHHRAASHSFPAWLLSSVVIASGLSLWHPGHFMLLFSIALIGVVVHVLLDILTPYGTQALWPISKHRFRLDVLFTLDPVFFAIGAIGFVLFAHDGAQRAAIHWSFGIATLYILARALIVVLLSSRVRRNYPGAERVSVLPQAVPWWWGYVAESQDGVEAGAIRLLARDGVEVRWRRPQKDSAVSFAMNETTGGRIFVAFARHLIWQVKRDGEWTRVYLADATYRFRNWMPFSMCISLAPSQGSEWRLGSEVLRGQTLDFAATVQEFSDSTHASDQASGMDEGRRLKPKIPSEYR